MRRRKNLQREQERKYRKAELIALRSQMNPHFIFNTLNGINAAILQSDKFTASEYLIQFSYMVRQVLNYTRKLETTMADELDFSKQYLELEQKRLKSNLTFNFRNEIPESDADHTIPSLSLQPFLENAIWHGLRTVDYPGHIDLHAFRDSDFIVLEIIDNGIGLEKSKKNSPSLF
jgi:sensor histidine kinase YesM